MRIPFAAVLACFLCGNLLSIAAAFGSREGLYTRDFKNPQEAFKLFTRSHEESKNLLYSRERNNQEYTHRDAYKELLRRELERQTLVKRVIMVLYPWTVAKRIKDMGELAEKTREHIQQYGGHYKNFNPEKSKAGGRIVADMVAKAIADKDQDMAKVKQLKEMVEEDVNFLNSGDRKPEADKLQKAFEKAYGEHERLSELTGAFLKKNDEFKRTGKWPVSGMTSSTKFHGAPSTESKQAGDDAPKASQDWKSVASRRKKSTRSVFKGGFL